MASSIHTMPYFNLNIIYVYYEPYDGAHDAPIRGPELLINLPKEPLFYLMNKIIKRNEAFIFRILTKYPIDLSF